MARLNDFAAPSESVEALKRRFVRQNREIARVNSMQSLRIRSLESEVSHLLAENVSLREQVINLTQEIERLEAAKLLHDGVYEIKGRLDTKLAELNTLISDLGTLPRKAGGLGGEKSEQSDRPKATALDSRPRMTDSEYHAGVDDGKLPAILEDKYYPRRTLEPQEIQNLVHGDSDLPEFPGETSLTHDEPEPELDRPSQEPNYSPSESRTDDDAAVPSLPLPSTLETRRKKKADTAAPAREDSVRSVHSPKVDLSQPVKSGSKRKFSPDDDGFLSDLAPEDDGFQFSRPSHSPSKQPDQFDLVRQDSSPSKAPASTKRDSAQHGITKRKVLEPKSANAHLGSPQKARAALNPDKKMPLTLGGDENTRSPVKPKELNSHKTSRALGQKARNRSTPVLQKQKRSSQATDLGETMPNQDTPITLKDSPAAKSGEGLPGMSDMMAASRPSRRQRAVVSYAEPNLRDKMRRPTSELIDAVGGHGCRRSSSFQLVQESLGDEDSKSRRAGASPPSTGHFPADLALADQATDLFAKGDASDQLSATVSRRRQARRHSSNPKCTIRDVSPQPDVDVEGASPLGHKSPSTSGLPLNDDEASEWKSTAAMAPNSRRETRVAARRKSMMV